MEAQIQQEHSTTGAPQFQQDTQSSSQSRPLQDHAGHGQRITLQQAQYALQYHNTQQHPTSQGTVPSAASTPASSVGLPLYRDQAGQIQLTSDDNANQINLYSQGMSSHYLHCYQLQSGSWLTVICQFLVVPLFLYQARLQTFNHQHEDRQSLSIPSVTSRLAITPTFYDNLRNPFHR